MTREFVVIVTGIICYTVMTAGICLAVAGMQHMSFEAWFIGCALSGTAAQAAAEANRAVH